MNRNNFMIHLALAIVLILVAAFAGQLNRWRTHWKSQMRIVPAEEKKPIQSAEDVAMAEARASRRPEVLVKFKTGMSEQSLRTLTEALNDEIEDRI